MLNKFCWVRSNENRTIFCWVRPIQKWVTYPEMSRISRNESVGILPLFYSIILSNHSIQSFYSIILFMILSYTLSLSRTSIILFQYLFKLLFIFYGYDSVMLNNNKTKTDFCWVRPILILYGYDSVMIMVNNLKIEPSFAE